ncbi:MAG: hypothetical protein JSV01_10525 [Desulfobacterales bacterium]|nr:MAG: hypothetical protein JSV01_10525 [Desulfobacterales bacterium]
MNTRDLRRERATLVNALKRNMQEFTGAYLAVCDLREFVRTHPGIVTLETIQVLQGVLLSSGFCDQTQSFFLYREADDILASIIGHAG